MATTALITYVFLRNDSRPQWILDLVLFNSVAVLAIVSLCLSPIPDDRLGRLGVVAALALWTSGSIASSFDTFFELPQYMNLDLFAEICYALFYPFALFGLIRALRSRIISRSLEFLDTLI